MQAKRQEIVQRESQKLIKDLGDALCDQVKYKQQELESKPLTKEQKKQIKLQEKEAKKLQKEEQKKQKEFEKAEKKRKSIADKARKNYEAKKGKKKWGPSPWKTHFQNTSSYKQMPFLQHLYMINL